MLFSDGIENLFEEKGCRLQAGWDEDDEDDEDVDEDEDEDEDDEVDEDEDEDEDDEDDEDEDDQEELIKGFWEALFPESFSLIKVFFSSFF